MKKQKVLKCVFSKKGKLLRVVPDTKAKRDIGYGILSAVVALAVYPFVMREMRKQYPYAFVDYDKLMRKVWFGSIVLTILAIILWVVLK